MNIRVRVGEFRVDDQIRGAVERVLSSKRVSEGKETREPEASFARYIGTRYAMSSRTTAYSKWRTSTF